jgi:hypothetical protein
VVGVAEVVRGVSIALGMLPLDGCLAIDLDADGQVEISELVAALDRGLAGCADTRP